MAWLSSFISSPGQPGGHADGISALA